MLTTNIRVTQGHYNLVPRATTTQVIKLFIMYLYPFPMKCKGLGNERLWLKGGILSVIAWRIAGKER